MLLTLQNTHRLSSWFRSWCYVDISGAGVYWSHISAISQFSICLKATWTEMYVNCIVTTRVTGHKTRRSFFLECFKGQWQLQSNSGCIIYHTWYIRERNKTCRLHTQENQYGSFSYDRILWMSCFFTNFVIRNYYFWRIVAITRQNFTKPIDFHNS